MIPEIKDRKLEQDIHINSKYLDVNPSFKKEKEPIYFYLTGEWYKGTVPTFYDVSNYKITEILESNFNEIKEEILSFYQSDNQQFQPMYVPHDYVNKKWVVYSFYGFMLRYPENLKKFPALSDVLLKIPNLVGAQISVLEPHSRIKAHISGSNALIRNHLGIVVPDTYPNIGIRVRQEERGWEEGKVIAFSESLRHYAWNNTDKVRIVLIVDTIHPDYINKKYYICAGSLAVIVIKMITAKYPWTKKMPKWVVYSFHRLLIIPFYFIFFLQNKLNINIASMLQKLKIKKE